MWRGVKIGSVTDVYLTADFEDLSIQIPVFIEVEPDRLNVPGERTGDPRTNLSRLIEKGLKAQLVMQSFVTGQLMNEVDFPPDKPVVLRGVGTDIPEIPTIPSTSEELSEMPNQYRFAGYDPNVIDFIRRCDTEEQALEIISFLLRKGEINKNQASALEKQLKKDGLRSFGEKKEQGFYFHQE